MLLGQTVCRIFPCLLALNLVAPVRFPKVVCSALSSARCARMFFFSILSRFQFLRIVPDCGFRPFSSARWLITADSSSSLISLRICSASFRVAQNPAKNFRSGPGMSPVLISCSCPRISFSMSPFRLLDSVVIMTLRMYPLFVSCAMALFSVFCPGSGRDVAP